MVVSERRFTVCVLFSLEKRFALSLFPKIKDVLPTSLPRGLGLSFLGMQKSWVSIFSYWLFKAYFTSRRDDWQTIIHMVFDKVANVIKHMVLGPHLGKEA